jgi:phage FluMu gp28-like protein
MKQPANRFINFAMTKRIAKLHAQGFCGDFSLTPLKKFQCVQDNHCYHEHQVSITLVDQVYDRLLKRICYLHTVETETGDKGLLILQDICCMTPSGIRTA